MQSGVPPVHEEDRGGLPLFWVDGPPPLTAALSFRVGFCDESLLNRGITHLVEHLALHPLRDREHTFNGMVSGTSMTFWASGTEQEVVGFFEELAKQLRSLPVDRLATEAGVLSAEADARAGHTHDQILSILFGPNGPGVAAYPERGFDLVGPAEVQSWADRHCCLCNAVLMVTGPPPAGLRVDLLAGEYRPYTVPGEELGYRPPRLELVSMQDGGICLGALTDRTTSACMAWEVLGQRLTDRLRHELGLVYEVSSVYLPLDRDTAYMFAGVAATEGRRQEIASGFMTVVHLQRAGNPTEEEVARLQRTTFNPESVDRATVAQGELQRIGMARLLRWSEDSWSQLMQERAEATPESIGDAFRAATDHGAVVAPGPGELGIPSRKKRSSEPVEGKRFRPRRNAPGVFDRLIVGPIGISALAEGRWVTMHWEDLALAERSNDSEWTLMNRQGSWMTLDTKTWWWRGKLARLLEEAIPARVRLPQARRP
ncbi:MAG: peptidase M16 family protein [Planctomycetota bacterium]